MEYVTFGRTGVKVSRIGFGGATAGLKNYIRSYDPQDKAARDGILAAIARALELGITYFDTAPGYGKSEDLFGVAIKEMSKTRAKKPFYISTKSARTDPAEVRRECETSLKRMNLDYIDFYHVWCLVTLDEFHLRKARGVLKEFEKLKSEGLIRHICVSSVNGGAKVYHLAGG